MGLKFQFTLIIKCMIAVYNKRKRSKPGTLSMTVDSAGCDQNTQWITIFRYSQTRSYTRLFRTPLYYRQFALGLGKENF